MGKLSRALQKAAEERKHTGPPARPQRTQALRQPLPFAIVPRSQENGATPDPRLVCLTGECPEVAEQVRLLRTNLLAVSAERPPQVIAIASATRVEGKSIVAGNLAVALGEIDRSRILLIDGDLNGPAQHDVFAIKRERVLNDVLSDQLDLEGSIYATAAENVHLMPARSSAKDHVTSISQDRCRQLIEKVRPLYDFVVIDTAPIMASAAASMLAGAADGTLIVIRMNKTSRHTVRRALAELDKTRAHVLGCVLTFSEHFIPDALYRFVGTTTNLYYREYGKRE